MLHGNKIQNRNGYCFYYIILYNYIIIVLLPGKVWKYFYFLKLSNR